MQLVVPCFESDFPFGTASAVSTVVINNKFTVYAFSYTNLDEYKRQAASLLLGFAAPRGADADKPRNAHS